MLGEEVTCAPPVTEVLVRKALLSYEKDPKASLGFLTAHLGLSFDHQREVPGAAPNLPTALDPQLIGRDALRATSFARWSNLDNFEAAALDWLDPTVRMTRAVGFVEPGVYFFLPDRLEALIAVGRHDDAEHDITEWQAIGRRYDRPFPLATGARAFGMLLTAQRRFTEAEDAFTEALLRDIPSAPERQAAIVAANRSGRRPAEVA